MSKYEMIIHVESAQDMAVIVQACQGTAELISSNKIEEEKKRKSGKRKSPAFAAGGRMAGLRGVDLLRKIFSDGKTHKTSEISSIFTSHGFASKSASPALSNLTLKSGELKQVQMGEYIATTKLKEVNSGEGHGR